MHELQIVHRDLKPSNILLGKDDTIKIADLGLAQIPGGMSQRSRLSSMVMMQPHPGTPDYMSPEQREKFSALQPPSDVYALGVVLFELLTGRNPYYEEPDCKVSNFRSIDLALEGLIQRMLKENPRDRPWNGKRLQEEFLAFSKTVFSNKKVDSATIDEENKKILRYEIEDEKQKDKQPFRKKAETNIEVFPLNRGKANQNLEMEDKNNSPEMPVFISKDQPSREEPQAGQIKTIDLGEGIQMEFVFVPAGEFWMGADEDDAVALAGEKPKHKVYLDAYWIGKYTVTNRQYACFIKEKKHKIPYQWKNGQIPSNKEDHPIVMVSWHDADAFTKWLSQKWNKRITLPTEAQWEKAARGTDGRIYPWGNETPNSKLLNYNDRAGDTTAVGSHPQGASAYGALDMAGNVREWVADWYDGEYYRISPPRNPQGPLNGIDRVQRGGSWSDNERDVRSSFRIWYFPKYVDFVGNHGGFRCAISD